jgi:hypothetical protein
MINRWMCHPEQYVDRPAPWTGSWICRAPDDQREGASMYTPQASTNVRSTTEIDRARLRRSIRAVSEWLELIEWDSTAMTEDDAADLLQVGALLNAGAPQGQLELAVRRARCTGWSWGLIAQMLGVDRRAAEERFGLDSAGGARRPQSGEPARDARSVG